MADSPNVTEPISAAPQTPAPTPAKEPTPAAQTPGLDPSQLLEIERDGQKHYLTASELVDRAFSAGPKIDPDKLAKLETYEKAMAGDADATRRLVESYLPKEQPKPADPAQTIASLQQELSELKSQVTGRVTPMIDQIEHLRHRSFIANAIESQKDKLPLLAQDPEGADSVLYYFKQQVKAMGMKDNDPRLTQILAGALIAHENRLTSIVQRYGGKTPAVTTNGNPAGNVVDDQRKVPASIPAGLMIVNGRIVDERGREYIQGADRQFREVPASVPANLPGGSAVPPTPDARPKGPITRVQMDQLNRERMAAIAQG